MTLPAAMLSRWLQRADEERDAALDRLEVAERVVEAVIAAGPWPRIDHILIQATDGTTFPFCKDCHRTMNLPHAEDCPGVAIANALDALTQPDAAGGE